MKLPRISFFIPAFLRRKGEPTHRHWFGHVLSSPTHLPTTDGGHTTVLIMGCQTYDKNSRLVPCRAVMISKDNFELCTEEAQQQVRDIVDGWGYQIVGSV
jgi:hypothetical protein